MMGGPIGEVWAGEPNGSLEIADHRHIDRPQRPLGPGVFLVHQNGDVPSPVERVLWLFDDSGQPVFSSETDALLR